MFWLPSQKAHNLGFVLSYLPGEESKVPNIQDVVHKIVNALYQSIMNHVVSWTLLLHSFPLNHLSSYLVVIMGWPILECIQIENLFCENNNTNVISVL